MSLQTSLSLLLILPIAASPLVYLAGRISSSISQGRFPLARWLSLLVFLASWVPLYICGRGVLANGVVELKVGDILMAMDGVGLFMAVTVLLLATVVTVFSFHYMSGEKDEEKYYALLPVMSAAMIGLSCARDLFNLWVWFEAMTISSYLLVAFYNQQKTALESAVKYLVQSAIGSLLVLLGISLVFVQTGSLNLDTVRTALAGSGAISLAAGALFVIGFGVKTALVPMHTWLPDAHSQAPSGISAMLSGVVIETGLIAMLRALGALSGATSAWGALLLAFGALNMIVGNLMALRQREVKRLLAYSSIAQVGYMLVGFGVALAYGILDGAAGGFFHLFNHAMMKGLAFLAAGALLYALYVSKGSHASLMLDDLNGASRRYPLTAFAFSVALLALGGLPPLSGFMSKWQILVAGGEVRSTPLLWLIIFTGLNSVLSLAYYAPMVNRMYRREPSEAVTNGNAVAPVMALPLVVLTLAVTVLGFWPAWMNWLSGPAASSLLTSFGLK
jgi:proton-translocating NADH-quinone oxidoreductase chain N